VSPGARANATFLRVSRSLVIPMSEIELRALGPRQRQRIRDRLRTRIDTSGTLQVSSGAYRSQLRNREDVLERLAALLEDALRVEKTRRPTKPSRRAAEERIQKKKRRGAVKRSRRSVNEDT
jgi:ribosome-associated protein